MLAKQRVILFMFTRSQIENRLAPGTLLQYTLHFGSREFMRNLRTKVSQAYDGRLDRRCYIKIMYKMKTTLTVEKKLTYEPCGN